MPLSIQLQRRLESFLHDNDLGSFYKQYKWTGDAWENGFPEMRQLEVDMTAASKQGYLTKSLILRVAKWGRLRNTKRVQCPEHISISLHNGDDVAVSARMVPSGEPLKLLGEIIEGMGPTYLSKVLMFSRPRLFGAIDTRLTRVFGNGDAGVGDFRWISLAVKNDGSGWSIPERQDAWPGEYYTWIEILHHMAYLCNTHGHKCPHPDEYVATSLREKGIWIAADIETALFSYASKRLKGTK